MIIERLKKVDSTNDYIKKYIKKREDAVVTSDIQLKGRGTKGRSFLSDEGGIYLTKLKFYNNLRAEDSFKIMQTSAVAVCKTLMAFDINAKIKWPNDIIANGKKICGILIQNSFSGDMVDYSITGIGLNVNNKIANEIKDIAISMAEIKGKNLDFESVLLTLITNLSFVPTNQEYRELSCVLNKPITVIRGNECYKAVAKDISDSGELILDSGERLSAGEIKLKITL